MVNGTDHRLAVDVGLGRSGMLRESIYMRAELSASKRPCDWRIVEYEFEVYSRAYNLNDVYR